MSDAPRREPAPGAGRRFARHVTLLIVLVAPSGLLAQPGGFLGQQLAELAGVPDHGAAFRLRPASGPPSTAACLTFGWPPDWKDKMK